MKRRAAHSSATDDAGAAGGDGVNAKDIERFADEQAIDHQPATLTQLTTARVSPPRGEPIVNLTPGTAVSKLASHTDFFLVSFTSPKTGSKTMGWILQSALAAPTVAVPAPGVAGNGASSAASAHATFGSRRPHRGGWRGSRRGGTARGARCWPSSPTATSA